MGEGGVLCLEFRAWGLGIGFLSLGLPGGVPCRARATSAST